MLSLGLTADQYREFMGRLATGYELRVTCQLLTPERSVLATLSHLLLDGQVDCSTTGYNDGNPEVGRTARLTFVDPDGTLSLDSTSPKDGAFYMDRMLRIIYSVRCSFGWVDVPVFTGPVTKVDRDGDLVDVECHGMEHYALGHVWSSVSRSGEKVAFMRELMNLSGEPDRYLDFADSRARLTGTYSVARDSSFWSVVWSLNDSLNRILYYDGRGVCISRPKSSHTQVAVVVRQGLGGLVAALPQVGYSSDSLVNAVQVTGAKGSKGKPTPQARVAPPRSHPLHPRNVGRFNKNYVRADFVDNSEIKSTSGCRRLALSLLDDHLSQQVDVAVDVMPLPHLEPWDVIRLETPTAADTIRVLEWSLPLVQSAGTGKPMSIGYRRNIVRPRRPVRKA